MNIALTHRLLLFICLWHTVHSSNAQRVRVPYFEDLNAVQLCGSATPGCQPGMGPYRSAVYGKFYDNNPTSILARLYDSKGPGGLFGSRPLCEGSPLPNANDIEEFNKHTLRAKVKRTSQAEFKATLLAALDEMLRLRMANIPADVKADIKAEFGVAASSAIEQEFDIEYKVVQLSQSYVDKITPCLDKQSNNMALVAGISVITLKGTWSSDALKSAMVRAEAKAAYQKLGVETKALYSKEKEVLLSGTVDKFAVIIGSSAY